MSLFVIKLDPKNIPVYLYYVIESCCNSNKMAIYDSYFLSAILDIEVITLLADHTKTVAAFLAFQLYSRNYNEEGQNFATCLAAHATEKW